MRTFFAIAFSGAFLVSALGANFTTNAPTFHQPAPVFPASAPATNAMPNSAVPPTPPAPSLYDFKVNSLDGKPVDLGQFRGKVTLVVNTASHCGYTPQYAKLEKLYEDYKDKGLVVLAFPSNDFGNQEPGSPKEIAQLCSTNYHVTFPIFEKTKTFGDGQSPVYQFLTKGHGVPQWNFHKYLVDKMGNVIKEFDSQTSPDDPSLLTAIDSALKS
jgi:glutathione peroxidase